MEENNKEPLEGNKAMLIQQAFGGLWPNKPFPYEAQLSYSGRMRGFHGKVRLHNNTLEIFLGRRWEGIDQEIQMGLVQLLLLKIFRHKKSDADTNTQNLLLYYEFMKKLPLVSTKTRFDPVLEASFHRVNTAYFDGLLEKPNLVWGNATYRKLASYDYQSDTVTVSSFFEQAQQRAIDYLVYHELLHKKFLFEAKNGKQRFHTAQFKQAEEKFENHTAIEKEIEEMLKERKNIPRKKHSGGIFRFFFQKI